MHVYGFKVHFSSMPSITSDSYLDIDTEHDFFGPQPIKNASVFFMRFITHDWPDGPAKKILKHLGDAAQPNTKLLLMENIIPHSAPSDIDVLGANVSPIPYPLLQQLGRANYHSTRMDLHVGCPYIRFLVRDSCCIR